MHATTRHKLRIPAFVAAVLGLALTIPMFAGPANSAGSTKSAKSAAAADSPQWVLVDRDEFDAGKLDRSHWTPFMTHGNTQNDNTIWDKRQITFATEGTTKFLRLKSSLLPDKSGKLRLTSAGIGGWSWLGNATGARNCDAASFKPGTTSACRTYGRYDVRLRMGEKLGVTGVGLLFPRKGYWPPEIDFFEVGYKTSASKKMEITHHFDPAGAARHQQHVKPVYKDFRQWHTVSTRWSPGLLQVYVDDVLTYSKTTDVPNVRMWPGFQSHFKYRPGFTIKPNESVNFDIDWVRVYRDDRIS